MLYRATLCQGSISGSGKMRHRIPLKDNFRGMASQTARSCRECRDWADIWWTARGPHCCTHDKRSLWGHTQADTDFVGCSIPQHHIRHRNTYIGCCGNTVETGCSLAQGQVSSFPRVLVHVREVGPIGNRSTHHIDMHSAESDVNRDDLQGTNPQIHCAGEAAKEGARP
jgi:hypothetical protein